MTPISIDTHGFPGAINELIARAMEALPTLKTKKDALFLREMCGVVLTVFWTKYMESLPAQLHAEMIEMMKQEDVDIAKAWMEKNCDILHDPQAKKRAEKVLIELQTTLPALLQKEYTNMIAHTNVQ